MKLVAMVQSNGSTVYLNPDQIVMATQINTECWRVEMSEGSSVNIAVEDVVLQYLMSGAEL